MFKSRVSGSERKNLPNIQTGKNEYRHGKQQKAQVDEGERSQQSIDAGRMSEEHVERKNVSGTSQNYYS